MDSLIATHTAFELWTAAICLLFVCSIGVGILMCVIRYVYRLHKHMVHDHSMYEQEK